LDEGYKRVGTLIDSLIGYGKEGPVAIITVRVECGETRMDRASYRIGGIARSSNVIDAVSILKTRRKKAAHCKIQWLEDVVVRPNIDVPAE
jgi:tRNA U34 5-carboxymethylaminomethyl modifying enzyme MnmG/GidA